MDVLMILEKCAQSERLVADIYYLFMRQQSDNPELCALWKKTAQEEENHEQQFMLAKRISKAQETRSTITVEKLDAIIGNLQSLLTKVDAHPPSPRESLRLAIAIEEKLADFHLNNTLVFSDESMNRLFASMMSFDKSHLDKLKEAYEMLSGGKS